MMDLGFVHETQLEGMGDYTFERGRGAVLGLKILGDFVSYRALQEVEEVVLAAGPMYYLLEVVVSIALVEQVAVV